MFAVCAGNVATKVGDGVDGVDGVVGVDIVNFSGVRVINGGGSGDG